MAKASILTITFKTEDGEICGRASGLASKRGKIEAEARRQMYLYRFNKGEDMVLPEGYTREDSTKSGEYITHHRHRPHE